MRKNNKKGKQMLDDARKDKETFGIGLGVSKLMSMQRRFEIENAEALKEAAEERRRLWLKNGSKTRWGRTTRKAASG